MKAYIIVDLGFGDAGKGTTVDFLSRLTPNTIVVRYNGGPQAGHNVVNDAGIHHTFSQFGSGTFVPSVKTYLSEYMLIDPLSLLSEYEALKAKGIADPLSRLFINCETKIVTPFHRIANRLKETVNRHGSCGVGTGEAVYDALEGLYLTAGMLSSPHYALKILKEIQEKKIEECKNIDEGDEDTRALHDPLAPRLCYDKYKYLLNNVVSRMNYGEFDQVIFEGSGGVLLDEYYGFHPHTMWTNTTSSNALRLWKGEVTTLGIIRTYSNRHGNGPFVSEEKNIKFVEPHNITNNWQGTFRVGALDLVATKYAMRASNVDSLVITHMDSPYFKLCDGYITDSPLYDESGLMIPHNKTEQENLTKDLFKSKPHLIDIDFGEEWLTKVLHELKVPLAITSFGTRPRDKKIIRLWK